MRYEVVGLLGRGAMAVVELAVTQDGTRVARKRLPLGGSALEMETARRRLRREAEILAALHHPSIVPVLDVEDDGTDVVIVMPALAGSLADRVALGGPLPPAQVVAAGRALLEGLAAAHRAGVTHRDVKPGNVLFDDAGRPALADFGVAVSRDLTAGLTVAGTVVGTPHWMAPEQARGESAGPASDVFSLGATLLFAATGQTPWGAGPPDAVLARAARGEHIPLPATVPTVLRAPLAAMLHPDPACRPSAAAVLGGLEGTELGAAAPDPTSSRRRRRDGRRWGRRALLGGDGPRPWSRRRRVAAAVCASAGMLAVAAVAAIALTGGSGNAAARHVAGVPGTAPACQPLVYQACGAAPAPHTDGYRCLPGWYDLDALAADGCEARSDYTGSQVLTAAKPITANLVPAGAVDTFTTKVDGHLFSLCSDTLRVELTSPAHVADRLDVLHGSSVVATATSIDGQAATATVQKPGCFGSHSEELTLRVSSAVGASAGDFVLSRSGGW
ncbi:serine/threonine protein kinase [Acidiferrimicrobium sp. IK]|uniref:serine/threonine-protein kinase n=1 Tax=Acidiferrimicrobium sp. IK TaxID=2871700 RepID=UPI0021CB6D6C|nr:serine/threonine-protein kinase [Acidiferrimicrobium sp. IK]MCU4184233.1 serine/threonine protein kinase [Acidiferrimicrobium sp. IK]